MSEKNIMINYSNQDEKCSQSLKEYCMSLAKRNQVVLYKLEKYLGKENLTDDEELKEIRQIILSVSGDIVRISDNLEIKIGG